MLKLLWYTVSIINILLILISSPTSNSIGNMNSNGSIFSITSSNQVKLQQIIFLFIVMFLICTILHVLYN